VGQRRVVRKPIRPRRRAAPGQAIPGTSEPSSFASSVPAKVVPDVLQLSLQDAIERGLRQNLGLLLSRADAHCARGERWQQLMLHGSAAEVLH
jgi:hypothetical protein